MVSLTDFIAFEDKIQSLFEQVIMSLPATEKWSCERNVYLARNRDIDLVIRKDGYIYAFVEIKAGSDDRVFRAASIVARQTAELLPSPYFFIVSPKQFGFFRADGDTLQLQSHPITENDILYLLTADFDKSFDKNTWIQGVKEIIKGLNEIDDPKIIADNDNIIEVLLSLTTEDNYYIDDKSYRLILSDEAESKLFDVLLGSYTKSKVCRFTTLGSIFRSLNSKEQSMCSIVAMNDKSETNYVGDYLSRRGVGFGTVSSGPNDWNTSFITSCCDIDRAGELTMFRLYADDAKGVCLSYHIDDIDLYPYFQLRPVSYQRANGSHPELDIICRLLQINANGYTLYLPSLSIWQHFFKPYEYEIEKEVRLLYRPKNGDNVGVSNEIWIHNGDYNIICPLVTFSISDSYNRYPLILEEIILGPKLREADINRLQLEALSRRNAIKTSGKPIISSLSPITHYR